MKNPTTILWIFHAKIAAKPAAISTKRDYEILMVILTIIGLLIVIYHRDDSKKG